MVDIAGEEDCGAWIGDEGFDGSSREEELAIFSEASALTWLEAILTAVQEWRLDLCVLVDVWWIVYAFDGVFLLDVFSRSLRFAVFLCYDSS